MKSIFPYLAATILLFFGLLTLFMSSAVIFDLFGIRAKEGNFVPFIVWTNFVGGFLYLFAAFGLIKGKKWTTMLLVVTAIILVVAFIGLIIHITNGGVYETRTIWAMLFRIGVTLVFAIVAWFTISGKSTRPTIPE